MELQSRLAEIVGKDFVSDRPEEQYLYSRDSGAQPPRQANYVVLPETEWEVQDIVKLANEFKVPITPMGGGFTTSALAKTKQLTEENSAGAMAVDLLLVRPVGVVSLVLGSAVFIVALPFSLLGRNTGESAQKLVAEPAKFTFFRPLGDF